jgi:twitching motility two-component system response regulator PilG
MIESRLKIRLSTERPFRQFAPSFSTISAVRQEHRLPVPTGKLVLLIDNSPTIRHIVERTLRKEGYEVLSFRDGIEAMRWFAEQPEARTPDLMLVGVSLPKMDGYEVIQRFKTKPRFAHTTCIVLSQRDSALDKLRGHLVGANDYITKPFTTQQLLAAVQKGLAGNN